ncbi:hypothetical protein BDD12DRAFT_841673 [Trichophaea hybrida]|nr:hypothetical protein BDD12DRAFT_841673 [Trichophaea hybrida]
MTDLLQDASLPKRGLLSAGQRNVAKRVAKELAEREPKMEEVVLFRPGDVVKRGDEVVMMQKIGLMAGADVPKGTSNSTLIRPFGIPFYNPPSTYMSRQRLPILSCQHVHQSQRNLFSLSFSFRRVLSDPNFFSVPLFLGCVESGLQRMCGWIFSDSYDMGAPSTDSNVFGRI